MKREIVEYIFHNVFFVSKFNLRAIAHISMEMDGFCNRLPKTHKGNDTVWVIVDCLTKSAH